MTLLSTVTNVKIKLINNNSIVLSLSNESNLVFVFYTLKILSNWTEFIPMSVYSVSIKSDYTIFKKKKSLSFFRYASIFELIDISTVETSSIIIKSGDNESSKIDEWEIRFDLNIENKVFKNKITEIEKGFGSNIKKMMKND